jgi:hypothetical protein
MKLIKHRKMDDGTYQMAVHVDPDKVLGEDHPLVLSEETPHETGDPDPEFVREFTWPAMPEGQLLYGTEEDPGPEMTEKDWIDMQRREAKISIGAEQEALKQSSPEGTKIRGEGKDL